MLIAAGGAAGLPGQPLEGGRAALGMDWLCDMCQATNFGRCPLPLQLCMQITPATAVAGDACYIMSSLQYT